MDLIAGMVALNAKCHLPDVGEERGSQVEFRLSSDTGNKENIHQKTWNKCWYWHRVLWIFARSAEERH